MGAAFIKQPNGRYCRFSSRVDCPTDINLTKQDIKAALMAIHEEDVDRRIAMLDIKPEWGWSYEDMKKATLFNNITEQEFRDLCKEMETPLL